MPDEHQLAEKSHSIAKEHGFWDKKREIGTFRSLDMNEITGDLRADISSSEHDLDLLRVAIGLARESASTGEYGPFGAIIVKDHEMVGSGINHVTKNNDPTAHAEIMAIREACKNLDTFILEGCTIYSSAEPCPMCEGAIKWARIDRVVYSATAEDVENGGFDDLKFKTSEIPYTILNRLEGSKVFEIWNNNEESKKY